MFANGLDLLFASIVRGQGLGVMPDSLAKPAIERGFVRPVLERALGTDTQLMVVYLERELMPVVTRTFVDQLITWAKAAIRDGYLGPQLLRERG